MNDLNVLDQALDLLLTHEKADALLTKLAQLHWKVYQSFVTAGFTEDQSFTLTSQSVSRLGGSE